MTDKKQPHPALEAAREYLRRGGPALTPIRMHAVHRLINVDLFTELPELLAGIGRIVIGGLEGKPARLTDARVVQIVEHLGRAYVQTHHDLIDESHADDGAKGGR